MIQPITFDPKKGIALPLPEWFKVTHQTATEITIEGNIPDEPKSNRRNLKVQIVFKIEDGRLSNLCLRRIRGEFQGWNKTNWEPYAQGGRVLTHRMLSNLVTAKTGNWW